MREEMEHEVLEKKDTPPSNCSCVGGESDAPEGCKVALGFSDSLLTLFRRLLDSTGYVARRRRLLC